MRDDLSWMDVAKMAMSGEYTQWALAHEVETHIYTIKKNLKRMGVVAVWKRKSYPKREMGEKDIEILLQEAPMGRVGVATFIKKLGYPVYEGMRVLAEHGVEWKRPRKGGKIDKEKLVALHGKGYTSLQLSAYFSVSKQAISYALSELGLSPNPPKERVINPKIAADRDRRMDLAVARYQKGKNGKESISGLRIGWDSLREELVKRGIPLRKNPRHLRKVDREELVRDKNSGMSWEELAKKYNSTPNSLGMMYWKETNRQEIQRALKEKK